MRIYRDSYGRKIEDINFLLEVCRVLLRKLREMNEDIPFGIEEIKRLRDIEDVYTERK
ncbi:MAG: hypothetical protein ACFFFB_09365 [Candidatus Heimdallarchaeota archaeon]